MKTLVLIAHPDLTSSRVNRRLAEELRKIGSDELTIRDLYAEYPDGRVDVATEQALVEANDQIIFQFPVYWYSAPALLHAWQADVLAPGWAYGEGGRKAAGKLIRVAVSAGSPAWSYAPDGEVGFTIEQILSPFKATAGFIGSDYGEPFSISGVVEGYSEAQLDRDAKRYANWVRNA